MKLKNTLKYFSPFLSVIFFLFLWYLISKNSLNQKIPKFEDVVRDMWLIVVEGDFFLHASKTFFRVGLGFIISLVLGGTAGILMGTRTSFERLLKPYVLLGLTIPAICWAALAIMWFGLSEFSAIFAIVVLVTPSVTVAIVEGMHALDISLIEMARVFRMSWTRKLFHITLPQLLPHFLAATRFGIALSWKVGVIVEMMGLSSGIGYQVNFWFGLVSMEKVLAWSLSFTICMFILEYTVLKSIERILVKWRPSISWIG